MLNILRTKFIIPPVRPKLVKRARLAKRMEQGSQRSLTLIVAPAGFGKTTLAAEWAQAADMAVVWLSLDAADYHPERFLSHLIHSIQQQHPQIGQTALVLLQSGPGTSPEAILHSLVNDLSEISAHLAIILDDYHTIDSPPIGAILQFLLDNRPPQTHFILTSRTHPSIGLTRLRALDQVIEITADDLRFTLDEIHSFLNESMDVRLTTEEMTRLGQSTEGWAVGLQLAALAHTHPTINWNTPAGQEHIFNYLAEEVLRREPVEVQDFLLRMSLFERFCIPLGDLLSTEEPCFFQTTIELLDYVERSNLFLVPLDASKTWYRFHALFADFLRNTIQKRQPELVAKLYRLANCWFEENNMLDEAIRCAIQAKDQQSAQRAAELIGRHYRDVLMRGEQSTLMNWLAELPPELMSIHPSLWLAKGWANIIHMDTSEAIHCADMAEAVIKTTHTEKNVSGELESLRLLINIFKGKVIPEEEISKAFLLIAEKDPFLHNILHFNLGMMHVLTGETEQALEDFQELQKLTQEAINPLVTIITWTQMGEQYQIRGEFAQAERMFKKAIAFGQNRLGERSFLLGMPYVSYAELLREQNRFDEALRFSELGIAYCLQWQPTASLDGYLALARLRFGQGRWAEAIACLDRALEVTTSSDTVLDDRFVTIQLARLHLLHDDLPQAMQWIKSSSFQGETEDGIYHFQELAHLVMLRAEVLGAVANAERSAQIAAELDAIRPEIERRKRMTPVIECLILSTYAFHSASNNPEAVCRLKCALLYGEKSGYIRLFADEGMRLLRLLEQFRSQLQPSAWLEALVKTMRSEAERKTSEGQTMMAADEKSRHPDQPTPLTRREIDVLQLMAAGHSNQEIANELVLALSTVKKHVANILGKLTAANRTQAVMLARSKNWIK